MIHINHKAGDNIYVDYAGNTLQLVNVDKLFVKLKIAKADRSYFKEMEKLKGNIC